MRHVAKGGAEGGRHRELVGPWGKRRMVVVLAGALVPVGGVEDVGVHQRAEVIKSRQTQPRRRGGEGRSSAVRCERRHYSPSAAASRARAAGLRRAGGGRGGRGIAVSHVSRVTVGGGAAGERWVGLGQRLRGNEQRRRPIRRRRYRDPSFRTLLPFSAPFPTRSLLHEPCPAGHRHPAAQPCLRGARRTPLIATCPCPLARPVLLRYSVHSVNILTSR
ncbi:hypothetical protein BDV95DRAFT_129736 [Massariosphaeria phaeospora]|uniref:Uncharacterized protein n=1 Tax=Massariosphaeria phaeospora TaxID=100035 RepID=A0A7C8MAV2_9PLEO|nr:hypothetical protein BDV95DRAFT_129736 [Massariosphaeria phaeospora]